MPGKKFTHNQTQEKTVLGKYGIRIAMTKLKIEKADTFWKRLIGLIGRKNLAPCTGMLIAPCHSIHMLFMRFSIDAVFIDKDFRIKKIVPNIKPWCGLAFCFDAWAVIELNAGEAFRLKLAIGQTLKLELI